jgi:small subunit ribosomal protein S5
MEDLKLQNQNQDPDKNIDQDAQNTDQLEPLNKTPVELVERVVDIKRVAKVVKGGKRFGFSTLTVVGDGNGRIGAAIGKANDVRASIEKSISKAKEDMEDIEMTKERSIPHSIIGKCGAAEILLKPAAPGTGIIAGGPARDVITAVGITDIFAKCLRSRNALNVVYATINGLKRLRSKENIADSRGKEAKEL